MSAIDIQSWLPVLVVAAGTIASFATMRAAIKQSDKRHDEHEKKLDEHDVRIRATETTLVGLRVSDQIKELQSDVAQLPALLMAVTTLQTQTQNLSQEISRLRDSHHAARELMNGMALRIAVLDRRSKGDDE